jgi:hypothetical protein
VLSHDGNDNSRVFRALAFMDGYSIGRNEGIKFAKSVGDGSAVEADGQFAGSKVDVIDVPDIAIINLLIVVVLDLHDLVTGGEGPTGGCPDRC